MEDSERDELARSDTVHASGGGAAPGASPAAPHVPAPGEAVGRFIVLGTLGTGGMGVVLSAYDPQLDRRVAVKLLRPDAIVPEGVEEARSRLLREAQAMAKISHPNVIPVHEVGTFGDQVYLAMEYVGGGTVKQWLRAEKRSWREVVDVFAQAARGLAAAHHAGLVHRDFKPDNVLLGDDGRARVTDFGLVGVAGETPSELESTLAPVGDGHGSGSTPLSQHLTRTGAVMGTPSYMAPEQFQGVPATVRADQFSFCVALYEGLYGERPFTGASLAELADHVISGQLPAAPRESMVPSWLRRVVARGLSRRPEDRYDTMEQLLAELERDRSARWRRLGLIGAGVLAVGSVAALVALRSTGAACGGSEAAFARLWGPDQRATARAAFEASGRPHGAATFDRVNAAVDAWGASWARARTDACEDTHLRGQQSGAALDLRMSCLDRSLAEVGGFVDMLEHADGDAVDRSLQAANALPGVGACEDVEALGAVLPPPDDAGTRSRIDELRDQLAEVKNLRRLGKYKEGLAHARELGAAAREVGYLPLLGQALWLTGQLTAEAGETGADEILREAARTAAAGHDDETFAGALADLIHVLGWEQAEYDAALELGGVTEAVVARSRPEPGTVARMHTSIGHVLEKKGDLAGAEARYRQALKVAEDAYGPDDHRVMSALGDLGNVLKEQARFDDARAALERVLEQRERLYGPKHPDVASSLNNLGTLARREGKFDEALALLERALAIREEALGPTHPEVGTAHLNIGTVYGDRAEPTKSEEHYRKALALWEAHYGPDHPDIGMALLNIGASLQNQGKTEESRAPLERTLALWEKAYGPDSAKVATVVSNLGLVQKSLGDLEAARASFERAVAIAEKTLGPDHPDVADYLGNLATVLVRQDRRADAIETVRRALGVAERAYGGTHQRVGFMSVNLGIYLLAEEKYDESERYFRKALGVFDEAFGEGHFYASYPLVGIGQGMVKQGRAADAVPLLEKAVAIRSEKAPGSSLVAEARFELGRALVESRTDRRRGLAEVRTALAEWKAAGGGEAEADARKWLRRHGR